MSRLSRLIALIVLLSFLTGCIVINNRCEGVPGMGPGMMRRQWVPIPAEYASLVNPIPTSVDSLSRGEEIYQTNCAACHGERGWGDGPAAAGLDPAPAALARTTMMLSDAYLFFRISEGGSFTPFDSAMPAYKDALETDERWDLINYVRSLGGSPMMPRGMMGG